MTALLFGFWLLLNARITVEIVLIGAVLSAALSYAASRILSISPWAEVRAARRLPGVFFYLLYLIGQVALSNWQVIRLILRPDGQRPRLVWLRPELKGELSRLVLANSITLTPGTVTVELGERGMCVYALRPAFAQGLADSGFVRRLRRLEGGERRG